MTALEILVIGGAIGIICYVVGGSIQIHVAASRAKAEAEREALLQAKRDRDELDRKVYEILARYRERTRQQKIPQWAVTLGVSTSASIDDIRSAYRKLAKTAHPDAGGSDEAMRNLISALRQAQQFHGVGK